MRPSGKGTLKIVKQGEVLDGFSKDFVYEVENLAGAVFEVYAADDIYTADFQKDAEGNRILEYAAGELVGMVTTDENGEAYLSDLPLGSYKVVEVTAPEGFVLNGEAQTVAFTYTDQETPVIEQEAVSQNDRPEGGSMPVTPEEIITEDSNSGFEFFKAVGKKMVSIAMRRREI